MIKKIFFLILFLPIVSAARFDPATYMITSSNNTNFNVTSSVICEAVEITNESITFIGCDNFVEEEKNIEYINKQKKPNDIIFFWIMAIIFGLMYIFLTTESEKDEKKNIRTDGKHS